MPVPTDVLAQFFCFYLDTVVAPLVQALEDKIKELQAQALAVTDRESRVANRGDTPSDVSSQLFPSVYPFPDAGYPSPPPPTTPSSTSCTTAANRRSVAPGGTLAIQHTVRHTESLPSTTLGRRFGLPMPRQAATTARAQQCILGTYTIVPFVDLDSTEADLAMLPSLSCESLALSEPKETWAPPPWHHRPAVLTEFNSDAEEEGFDSMSDLGLIPSFRQAQIAYTTQEKIVHMAKKTEQCWSWGQCEALPSLYAQKARAVLRPEAAVAQPQNDCVQVAQQPIGRHRRVGHVEIPGT
ncbi:unnamed protein product [Dibothriocephalus latus]|uniref:Uncharacterized protein n=1 Tax=Dibothriocephalus latus TaxID=60516 RepID=A0A3P7MZ62_DIBLA|nr:unnamed protein product [Dibothriocephalus latus]